MQGFINQKTIQDIAAAMFYPATANTTAPAAAPVEFPKCFHSFMHRAAFISCYFSTNNNPWTHFTSNKFSLPSYVTEKCINKNRSGRSQKLIISDEVKAGTTLKGFLNIFKMYGSDLATLSKNNQKKRVYYYTDQPQNDLLRMRLKREPKDTFVVTRQEAIDKPNHLLKKTLCQGNTKCITHTNNSPNCYFFFTHDDSLINRRCKAAHWSFKLSTHYYVSEKPILKKRPEPPLH